VERQIEDTYVKTGVVRFGYLHLAFLGQESEWAAEASECADEQGQFWAYHNKLFASQNGENKGAFARDNLKQFAADLKLDTAKFNACLDSGRYTQVVQAESQMISQLGVQSTPTFLVNTHVVSGAESFDTFAQLIETAKNGGK
jgi:protein-disulfide isomerase